MPKPTAFYDEGESLVVPLPDAEIMWLAYLQKRPRPSFATIMAALANLMKVTDYSEAGKWMFERIDEAVNVSRSSGGTGDA